jgi:predicted ATPase/signal transduction histidine kinase
MRESILGVPARAMTAPSPYTIIEPLPHGSGTSVYRALRDVDRCPVILKVLDTQRSGPGDLEQLEREYEIGRLLDIPSVVKPLALETYQGMPALVLEDLGGQSLDALLGAPMAVGRFLALAILVADAVADVHRKGVVHGDLKPHNVVVDVATGEVKLADFGLASRLSGKPQSAEPLRLVASSLPYLSPEQTGRMNRPVDNRSDLYSLGVIFHEMLTGKLPFEARDPAAWVHCHIARAAPSPSRVVPAVPEALARIVLKLLSKMPGDRYQTARGLRLDLERCLASLHQTAEIEPFEPGERDVSDRLQIPERLHGREAEVAELLQGYGRVVATGTPELLLVSGYSGIGKTALVHELRKPIMRARGFFLSGKFDQHKQDIPYATLVQPFRELVLEILAEGEARIADFRQRLSAALGNNGQLILDVIPPVELLIGRQPPIPELPPAEALNRFRMVFRRFVGAFAREEHALGLILDDLQWADPASLSLLQDLLAHPELRHVLVVGAYRDNEVSSSHPLTRMVDEVRSAGTRVSTIALGPIPPEHHAVLLAEALRCRVDDAAPLADLVYEKTAGNPFFAIQFLTALHEERLIELDEGTGAFRWDVARIGAKNFTDNVVDLMVGKLRRLPARTQEALQRLACLGGVAEVALLTMIQGGSEEEAHADLSAAVGAGLVLRLGDTYRFLHDRVQEAAYSLIPEGERATAHLGIGRLLSARVPKEAIEEKIFEIVNQLDRGAARITEQEERERVAELDLTAGLRAKRSAAYASALKYLAAGAALLDEGSWGHRYELAFAIGLHRAECEYFTGELQAAEERLDALWHRALNLVDLASVACARLSLYTTQDRSDRAVDAALRYLRLAGVEWSPHPPTEEVRQEFERLWSTLGSRPVEELMDLPSLTDPCRRATMDVLATLLFPALYTDGNLTCLVIARMANFSLEHGNSDASCLGYVWLAVVLGPYFGEHRRGFRFGKLGVDLMEKRGQLGFKARVYAGFAYLVSPWSRHLRDGIGLLRHAFRTAHETGDLVFATNICNNLITLRLAEGDALHDVQREAEDALELGRKAKFGLVVDRMIGQIRLIRTLRGLTPDFCSFDDAAFDEGRFEQHLMGDPRLSIAACFYWIRKLQARYLAGDHAGAVEAASKAEPLLWTAPSFFELAEYHFYGALARAARHDEAPASERPRHLTALAAHHLQLQVWAARCPESFGNRAALVAAEIARLGGEGERAAALYEQAIGGARENGFVQNEAVAHETAARFYRGRGFELIAETYLREACARYLRWGADGKVRQLQRREPWLDPQRPLAAAATLAMRPDQLDLFSVTKASQTISGEMVLDKLVRTLLEVVLEQGGAQRAYLILSHAGRLSIEAEAALGERGAATSALGSAAVDSSTRVPASLVRYVQRTREPVILDDAAAGGPGKFSGDDYFARVRPKSVLCLPILRQAEVVGLLYLENDLLAGAFTPGRLAGLELLATQAAISLENALLLAKEQAARAAAEDAERRAAFLAEAGALLAESLDYQETFARLGRLCVRSLATHCFIDIVEDGEVRRLSVAHADPAHTPLLKELQRRYPPRWGGPHPSATVLRTGEPLLLPETPDELLRTLCVDDRHLQILRELGTRTVLAVPLLARGQMLGVLTMSSDAPGRRYGRDDLALAEEVARRAAITIDNARLYRASQEAARAQREFLTVASHELNTPLTSLMLAVEAIRRATRSVRPVEPSTMSSLLDLVGRQGARLTRLTRDLLDVSRIEAGRLALDLEDVDLGALVREVVARFEADLLRSRCSVSIRVPAPVQGRCDRSRIDQVVTNLLANAIKFGAGKPIEIRLDLERGMARVAVQDHGIGVAPEQHDRIFERFERAVSVRHYGGLGLGLFICRRIMEDHGGSIGCESEVGAGATFSIQMPAAGAVER